MAKLSETDLKPCGNRMDYDNTTVHIHLDDGHASGFCSHYDKVFLCKADITFFKRGFSQTYIFHIYVMNDGIDKRLSDTYFMFKQYTELKDRFRNVQNDTNFTQTICMFVNACNRMEDYLSDKNGWDSGSFMIEDIRCKIISREVSRSLNSENIKTLFGYI